MLFSEEPQRFFPVTRIEVAQFPNGAADPEFIEVPPFTGPVQKQIQDVLATSAPMYSRRKYSKCPDRQKPGGCGITLTWHWKKPLPTPSTTATTSSVNQ
jgi:hypothetical protein